MATAHNKANQNDIADIVIMSGDPLRIKRIKDKYLEDAILVNDIRNIYAYTGTYKGKRITLMAHGMGIPSMGIYAYELFKFYNVKKIIRLGSCGAYSEDLNLLDIIMVDKSYTESNFSYELNNEKVNVSSSSEELNKMLLDSANKLGIKLNIGNVMSTDCFDWYVKDINVLLSRLPKDVIAAEMESFALFYLAKMFNREASCLLTVVDSHYKKEELTGEERESKLDKMALVALESI
ncbi:MAG: purine-nucleoside phosphorylase [Bacilli bacterium]|nr:purine-nucleoside phosphorylase [Bacilli bacterium]